MKNKLYVLNEGLINTKVVNEVIEIIGDDKGRTFELENSNLNNSTVYNYVTISLSKSLEYKELTKRQKELEEALSLISKDNQDKYLECQAKVNHQKEVIIQYVADTLRFADELSRIDINTERLNRVKEHFEKGEIKEARAIFQNGLEQMTNEYEKLLAEKKNYEEEILPKLKHNSLEFLLMALLTKTDYKNLNRFTEICKYFNYSNKNFPTKHNHFLFASFLQETKQFDEATEQYEIIVETFVDELESWEKASLYDSLGFINFDKKNVNAAINLFSKSLEIWITLADINPTEYEISVVNTLNNLGEVYKDDNQVELSIQSLDDALIRCRKLFAENSAKYSNDLVSTLTNLGNAKQKDRKYVDAAKDYIEAWEILEEYKDQNQNTYSDDKSKILFNLGVALQFNGERENAIKFYLEALTLREELSKLDSEKYTPDLAESHFRLGEIGIGLFPDETAFHHITKSLEIYDSLAQKYPEYYISKVAMVFRLLAIVYQDYKPNREQSINFALQAIRLLLPTYQHSVVDQNMLESSLDILANWGLNQDEIQNLIGEKFK